MKSKKLLHKVYSLSKRRGFFVSDAFLYLAKSLIFDYETFHPIQQD